jgi:type 1 glutamine amidotransferase
MHIPRRRFLERVGQVGTGLALGSLLPGDAGARAADGTRAKALKVCLLSGSKEYRSDESLAAYQRYLEAHFPVTCSRAFWTSVDKLPGLDALDTADLAIVFTKRLKIRGVQLERVKKYCTSGKPLIGVRTASHAFQNWLALDKEVFGGDYHSHYGAGPAVKVEIAAGAQNHPVLSGVKPFSTPTKLYKNFELARDTQILLTGEIPGHKHPVAWTREHKGGRVFYTSLGGPDDFKLPNFIKLLTNAVFWTTSGTAAPVQRP